MSRWTSRRRVAGLGAAAGMFLTAAVTPLATAPAASADLVNPVVNTVSAPAHFDPPGGGGGNGGQGGAGGVKAGQGGATAATVATAATAGCPERAGHPAPAARAVPAGHPAPAANQGYRANPANPANLANPANQAAVEIGCDYPLPTFW